jgi:hypothetical protein
MSGSGAGSLAAAYTWTLNLRGTPPKGKYTLVLQANPRSTKVAPSAKVRKTLLVR